MPKDISLKKILVIGSGPIVIGQAAEFDYAGTQACQALKEEGVTVVLINSNPATIMTDHNIADRVYIEPLTSEFVVQVIRRERPDGILATLGGQTGLNLAMELAEQGILEAEGVKLLGTDVHSIISAEDRERFCRLMDEINEPVPESCTVYSVEEATVFASNHGYPVIVRPAYTLGGTGGGIVHNEDELKNIVDYGLRSSPIHQCLIEQSIAGYKEIEYEIMRDAHDNCVVICNMENVDPVGIHTGDSIVFAPSQTLSDKEYQMLRDSSLKIIRSLGICGGCNVQFALNPVDSRYYVIEVNPRVSRSSALASKATGYPIARIAAKVAIGYTLDELVNPVTQKTYACFEPSLDYVVSKIPRWPFDKFTSANRELGTQMKATGEVMAIGRTIEESLLKAVRSLEIGVDYLMLPAFSEMTEKDMIQRLEKPDDERMFLLAEWFRRGYSLAKAHEYTQIDSFFLHKIFCIIEMEKKLAQSEGIDSELLLQAKRFGFTDQTIAGLCGLSEEAIKSLRVNLGIQPVYKMVDTCAGEFEAETPYYYSTYEQEDEVVLSRKETVIVLGSGPIRIGQGIEFDYSTVHAIWAIQEAGFEAVIINNNPETVSTDFSTSDRLYFEPLYKEDVLNIIEKERPIGVIVQFGGQTALNLAHELSREGIRILGTSLEEIDRAEDREKFESVLSGGGIAQPPGTTVRTAGEAIIIAETLGYPLLVRPSYVLGGRAMEIVSNETELFSCVEEAVKINPKHPVLLDRYLLGKEVEIDALCDGDSVLIPGIMEHVERAGVHSGDSIAVYPPQTITAKQKQELVGITTKIARAFNIRGLLNIQFVIYHGDIYVLEVNPRASRTVPFLSKVTGIPMAQVATRILLGKSLYAQGYASGLWPEGDRVSVKVPVFSFAKLPSVEIALGPEMKSTGEVMGHDRDYARAVYKGLIAAGISLPRFGTVVATISDREKNVAIPLMRRFDRLGYRIVSTDGTAHILEDAGLSVNRVNKLQEGSPHILDLIEKGAVHVIVNTWTRGEVQERDGFRIRREAVERGIACFTSLDTVEALLATLESAYTTIDSMCPPCLPQMEKNKELVSV